MAEILVLAGIVWLVYTWMEPVRGALERWILKWLTGEDRQVIDVEEIEANRKRSRGGISGE